MQLTTKIGSLGLSAPLCVQSGTPVGEVVGQVQQTEAGCVLIYRDGELAGIMTERDVLLKIVARDVDRSEPVDGFMTPEPITLKENNTIGEAIDLMNRRDFRHIPVLPENGGEAMAVLDISDIINYLAESFPEQVINLPPRPHQTLTTPEGA
jgi:CBS domain-containing protein